MTPSKLTMIDQRKELLPCPFCGGDAFSSSLSYVDLKHKKSEWLITGCKKCEFYFNGDEGREIWNTRQHSGAKRPVSLEKIIKCMQDSDISENCELMDYRVYERLSQSVLYALHAARMDMDTRDTIEEIINSCMDKEGVPFEEELLEKIMRYLEPTPHQKESESQK